MNAEPVDLLSLVLTLRLISQPAPGTVLPRWWGRAAHALLLNIFRQVNPELAKDLHKADNQRPFTVSTLIGRFPKGTLDRDELYTLRLTGMRKDVCAVLLEAAAGNLLSLGSILELDYLPFQVVSIAPQELWSQADSGERESNPALKTSPWAAVGTYQEISAALLLAKEQAPRKVSLQFTSPTVFKSGGKHVPLPLPGLVFGSLLERWNQFAPVTFPAEAKRYAEECLAVARYRLSSRVIHVKSRGMRIGAVGEITYTSLNYDRYWMSVIAVLAAFALYAGVGAGTSMGMGQCRQN